MKRLAVVKVRGNIRVPATVKDTMHMMHLNRVNHCSIVDDRKTYKGMLQTAKDYITWGEIGEETFTAMFKKRARLAGGGKVTDEYIAKTTDYRGVGEFIAAFMKFEAELSQVPGLKPIFRLSPPKRGYKSTKKSFGNGGDLGNRGEDINALLGKMI